MTDVPEGLQVPPPAPVPGCRLCVATLGGAESAGTTPTIDDVAGPSFAGPPVLASDGATLAVVGRIVGDLDRSVRVWRGQPGALDEVCVIDLDVDLDLVALVRHLDQWHLFGAGDDGAAWHGTSADLVTWTVDERFTAEHPLLVVRGATSMPAGVVILGEVVSHGRRLGWTLLEGSVGPYRAREITFPLTADHGVVGPVQVNDDELGLVLSSGATHLVARTVSGTNGRSWTLGLLAPDVAPTHAFVHERQMWVAGTDPSGGAPLVAEVGGRAFQLDRTGRPVGSGTIHLDQMVLARCDVMDDRDLALGAPASSTETDAAAQSSPAYIDSISAA